MIWTNGSQQKDVTKRPLRKLNHILYSKGKDVSYKIDNPRDTRYATKCLLNVSCFYFRHMVYSLDDEKSDTTSFVVSTQTFLKQIRHKHGTTKVSI